MINHLYPVILAGGSGTRFWPLSRQHFPKQLLRIRGDETLVQDTLRRVLALAPAERIRISTTPEQAEGIRLQLGPWTDSLANAFIVEPEARNTAPALALAATRILLDDPDAILLALPADHVIRPEAKFRAAVAAGAKLAAQGHLVTFGVKPTRPETGYGYIKPKLRIRLGGSKTLAGHPVDRFVEKPDAATARRYLRAGGYYWNSGIFVWRAATLLEEIRTHQPALARGMDKIAAIVRAGGPEAEADAIYRTLPSISIDYGVMERSSRTVMVPANFHWSDVGSWQSLEEVTPPDRSGNIVRGNVVDLGSRNSILFGGPRLVATLGLTDMVVVDTPDATLVCPKERSQDVKQLVEVLRKKGAPERLEHRTSFRPWGSYTVLEEGQGYKVKRLTLSPGRRLSLQLHRQRSEHWVVVAGTARVTCGDRVFTLETGESATIPRETKHRLENPGTSDLEIIEVQNGPYLGEDDIARFADDYGRSTSGS